MRTQDTYKEVRVFKSEIATARVYIPDLTPEERSRRMKEVEKAAIALLESVMPKKEKEEPA